MTAEELIRKLQQMNPKLDCQIQVENKTLPIQDIREGVSHFVPIGSEPEETKFVLITTSK